MVSQSMVKYLREEQEDNRKQQQVALQHRNDKNGNATEKRREACHILFLGQWRKDDDGRTFPSLDKFATFTWN